MDISKIDYNFIEIFHASYLNVQSVFEVEPVDASVRIKKRIRKWVEKTDIAGETFPAKVMKHISKDASDDEFIAFLKACHDHVQLHGTHQKQLFDKFSAELSEDVKDALWALLERCGCYSIRKVGLHAQIDVEFGGSYSRTLTFLNASGIPEGENKFLSFDNGSLVEEDGQYRLIGEVGDFEEDTLTPFAIRFADATVEVTVFRADEQTFVNTPWQHLQSVTSEILDKCFLPGDYLNDREKALLPLLAEISKLSYWARIPEEYKNPGFPQLIAYVREFGYSELLPLFHKLEKEYDNTSKKDRLVDKITTKLNKQKYAPLWQTCFNLIVESQKNYPSNASVAPAVQLSEVRKQIQSSLEALGYTGTYPDFVKRGSIPGFHLAESYNMSYFVGFEKNVAYHIHCTESWFNENLEVEFLCGTELLRKNETPGNIYSCLFDAAGRRFFQTISYEFTDENGNDGNESGDLAFYVAMAAKKAELMPLTKEERKKLMGFDLPWWRLFVLVFLIMGVPFGVFMTLGMMGFGAVFTWIVAGQDTIPEMLADGMWWQLFLLSWALFGGIMGMITVMAKKK